MAISQTRYVEIASTVVPQASVARRELIGRFYTSNDALKTGDIVELTSLSAVAALFGQSSTEYRIAEKYMKYVSSTNVRPTKISFANYNPNGRKATLKATKAPAALSALKEVTAGSMKINLGGVASDITGLDFSSCADLSEVATAIQTAIRAVTANGEIWTAATVTYSATDSAFILQGGTIAASEIGYASAAASGTDVSAMIKWNEANLPFLSAGIAVETPVECLTRSMEASDNCGSFAFIDALTSEQIANVASWNHTKNVEFIYSVAVNASNYATIQASVKDCDGCALTYSADGLSYYMPMAIMAGTNYGMTAGTVIYMFRQFANEQATVTSDALADTLDAIRVNYYGQTQSSGQNLAFYQRGYLQGEIFDMGVYANEIWLKSEIRALSLSLFVNKNKIPANKAGEGLFRTSLQTVIENAIDNGTILANKTLTTDQRSSVLDMTGDEEAYRDIEQNGYWLNVKTVQANVNGVTDYHLKYTLLYSKGDAIRKIEGLDVLL